MNFAVAVQVPPPKDIAEAIEKASENIDRTVGKKDKFVDETLDQTTSAPPANKRVKMSHDTTESEVESILSGKVLDTDIPGLEEFMSSESKAFFIIVDYFIAKCTMVILPTKT